MFDVSRFMESLLSIFRLHWDHEPGRRNGARLCEPQHVVQTKLLRVTDPRSEIRFMESAPPDAPPGGWTIPSWPRENPAVPQARR